MVVHIKELEVVGFTTVRTAFHSLAYGFAVQLFLVHKLIKG